MIFMVAFVYIVSGDSGALHVDVTLSLIRAMWQHRAGVDFTGVPAATYTTLLYYERYHNIRDAHVRKSELARAEHVFLEGLIERRNDARDDLSAHWFPIAAHSIDPPSTAVVETAEDSPAPVGIQW